MHQLRTMENEIRKKSTTLFQHKKHNKIIEFLNETK